MKQKKYLSWFYGILNVSEVLTWHGIIVLYVVFSREFLSVFFYFVGLILFSLIHQRVLSEWIHEASHFNFFPSRRANDFLANTLMSFFMLKTITAHRQIHLQHHAQEKYFGEQDPETGLYAVDSKAHLMTSFLKDILGLTAFKIWKEYQKGSGKNSTISKIGIIGGHGLLVVLSANLGYLWSFLVYYVTLVTIYMSMNRIRIYGQHASVEEGREPLEGSVISRTVYVGLIEKLFLTSNIMAYHNEHHENPGLPFRQLVQNEKSSRQAPVERISNFLILKRLYKQLD